MKRLVCVCLAVMAFASLGAFRPNPSAGSWSGTWSGEGGSGQVFISVGSTNRCIGEITNDGFGPAGRFGGTISGKGDLAVKIVGWPQVKSVPMKGHMMFDGQGGASGTFIQTLKRGLSIDGTFALRRS